MCRIRFVGGKGDITAEAVSLMWVNCAMVRWMRIGKCFIDVGQGLTCDAEGTRLYTENIRDVGSRIVRDYAFALRAHSIVQNGCCGFCDGLKVGVWIHEFLHAGTQQ